MEDKKFTIEEVKMLLKAFHLDSVKGCYNNELRLWSDEWFRKNVVETFEISSPKHIVKKSHYWLFKKINEERDYFYVRTMTDGQDRIAWFVGYENHFGSVSSVGGSLSDDLEKQLESEFQLLKEI